MAIYKPSNCSPFLSCLDLTKPQNISCELNTSNEVVTGYKIKILDSNNDVVFEGSEFDSIKSEEIKEYDNSGLNGSILTLPFIVEGKPINSNTIGYINGEFIAPNGSVFVSNKFSNNYANQPYKWEIMLSQTGKFESPNEPTSDEYYDMMLDQGKVLGSTKNRLQSALSENITKDYFIQLNNRTTRVPIKSYDYSFGYVYPKENVITDEEIGDAEYFEIYKYSNDPDVISAASQVLINTHSSMNNVYIGRVKNSVAWGSNLVYPNYFTQKFMGIKEKYESLPASAYDDKAGDIQMGVGSVIMVSQEADGNSAYNGIFNLQSIDNEDVGDGKYNLTVKWIRNAAADTWATLTNKVYFIQEGADHDERKQVKTNSGETGVINSSPVIFEPEKPVELYTIPQYKDDLTKAPIYKNSGDKIYIRPYSGPKKNIRFAYIKPEGTVFVSKDGNIISDGWYFKPNEDIEETLKPDEVSYKILTFFNNSDENPFYANVSPTLEINSKEIQSNNTFSGLTDYKCVSRVLNVSGEVINRKWMNYKWVLTDLNMGYTQQTETTYVGDISATFQGLQNNHIYELSLTIEDEFGDIWIKQKIFEVVLTVVESGVPFSVTYECETQSVLLDFSEKGIIVPEPSILKYENYLVKIDKDGGAEDANYQLYLIKENDDSVAATVEYCVLKDGGKSVKGYSISYDSNGLTLSDIDTELQENLIPTQLIEYKNQRVILGDALGEISSPSSDDITLNSQHILNSNFTGTVVSYKIETKDVNSLKSYLELNVIVPPTQYYSSKEGKYIANNDRNVLFLQIIKNINDREVWNSNKEITLYEFRDNGWDPVNKNRWQENKQIALSSINPDGGINEDVDYLKTTNSYEYKNGEQIITTNQNIFDGYNSNKGLMEFPLFPKVTEKQGETYNIWSDKKLKFVRQTFYGDNINVKTNEYNEWKIKNGDNHYYWHIYGNGGEPIHFVPIDHSGRQNINKYKFTFNIVIKDYNNININNIFVLNNIKAKVFKEIV